MFCTVDINCSAVNCSYVYASLTYFCEIHFQQNGKPNAEVVLNWWINVFSVMNSNDAVISYSKLTSLIFIDNNLLQFHQFSSTCHIKKNRDSYDENYQRGSTSEWLIKRHYFGPGIIGHFFLFIKSFTFVCQGQFILFHSFVCNLGNRL